MITTNEKRVYASRMVYYHFYKYDRNDCMRASLSHTTAPYVSSPGSMMDVAMEFETYGKVF